MEKNKHIILDPEGAKLWLDVRANLVGLDSKNVHISDNLALKKVLRGYLDGNKTTRTKQE